MIEVPLLLALLAFVEVLLFFPEKCHLCLLPGLVIYNILPQQYCYHSCFFFQHPKASILRTTHFQTNEKYNAILLYNAIFSSFLLDLFYLTLQVLCFISPNLKIQNPIVDLCQCKCYDIKLWW